MLLSKKILLNLPVYTPSGRALGRICDFELDSQSQSIIKYHIASHELIKGLLENRLIVDREQVVSLDSEKMVVEENTVKKEAAASVAEKAVPAN